MSHDERLKELESRRAKVRAMGSARRLAERKAASFVVVCDSFNIPIILLADTPRSPRTCSPRR